MVSKPLSSEEDVAKEGSAAWGGEAERCSRMKAALLFPFLQPRSSVMDLCAPSLRCAEIRAFIYPLPSPCFADKARF